MSRRGFLYFAVGLAAVLAALVVLVSVVAPREIAPDISRQIAAISNRQIAIGGDARLELFPRPRAILEKVTFPGNAGAPLVTVDRVVADLRLLPLLIGRAEARTFQLKAPVFHLVTDAEGKHNWTIYEPDDFDAISVANPHVGTLVVSNGRINYENEQTGETAVIEAIDAEVDWKRFLADARLRGTGTWNGETISITADADRPANLMFSGTSRLMLAFDNRLAKGKIDGQVRAGLTVVYDGRVDASITDLQALAAWVGREASGRLTPKAVTLSSRMTLRGTLLAFEDAALVLDGQSADGAFSLDLSRKTPAVKGTLAFDTLNLDTMLAPRGGAPSPDAEEAGKAGSPDAAPVTGPLGLPRDLVSPDQSVDLRISARRLGVAGLSVADVALALTLAGGRADLGIGSAEMAGGMLAGTVTIDASAPPARTVLSLSAAGLALSEIAERLPGQDWMSGTANAGVEVVATGDTWPANRDTADGTITVKITNGTFQLADSVRLVSPGLPDVVGTIAERSLRRRVKGLAFARAAFDIRLAGGTAWFEAIDVSAPGFHVTGDGSIALVDGAMAFRLLAAPGGNSGADPIVIDVSGDITHPVASTDLAALARLFGSR